jgi:hypothetical protein
MAFLFLGLVVETPPPPPPGAVPPAGAAAAAAAAAALALRGGGVPAFLKTDYFEEGPNATPPSRTYLAAALRLCGGVDRPPLVQARASEFVTALAARRRTRGALLRALAAVMADAAAPVVTKTLVALDEDARVTLCVRALGLARSAAELARRDRVVAAQLSILAAHAHLRGDRAALVGDAAESNTNTSNSRRVMFLKLRASAACDAARRVDRDSLVAASRGAARLLGDASPDVRVAAAGAIAALATVLVAAEASFAAAAVAARVGECHLDRGDGDVPAGRWSVPRDDWQQGLGEGDDDMVPEGDAVAAAAEEEEAAEERAEKKKKEAPKRSRHADFSAPVKEEESNRAQLEEDEALDPEKALRSGEHPTPKAFSAKEKTKKTSAATDPLEGFFVPAATSRLFDSARLLVSLDRAAAQDTHVGARDALLAAREAVSNSRARAVAAARRVATGGVLGAHVATWASLAPLEAPLPGVVDATSVLKFEALVRPMRRRIAEQRRLSRQQVDANAAGDADVEAARALEWEARKATEEEVAAYGLLDVSGDDGVHDASATPTEAQPTLAGVSTSASIAVHGTHAENVPHVRKSEIKQESLGAPRLDAESASESASSRLAAREAFTETSTKKPKSPSRVTSPVRGVPETLDEAHVLYLARVKRLARRAAESHDDAPLTAGELVRTTGPTKQTVAAVMTMLGRSVAKQHEKHEHAARARVANKWREAREKDARREAEKNIPLHLLRKGGTLTNATNVAPRDSREPRETNSVSRAPVDLAALRAARRDAPPGGDMQLSRPTGSRPALERARASNAFRRVAETRPPDAVTARRAKQAAEDAVKAARKAEISRRYYGTDKFKKPVVKKNLDADGPRVVKDSSGRTWMM